MNSAMTGANLGPSLMPSASGKGRSLSSEITADGLKSTDFNAIFSQEVNSTGDLAGLEQFLSADQLSALRTLLANGNELPVSADIADGTLLGNPALLQLMVQLSGEIDATESSSVTGGSAKSVGAQFSLADLQSMLLRQQGGRGKGEALAADSGAKPINPTSLLLPKAEIPLELQTTKPALLLADISTALTPGNAVNSSASFSSLLSGMEPIASQRLGLSATLPNGMEQLSSQRSGLSTLSPITLTTGEKGWDNVLSNRIMWMVGKQMQNASLQITPRHLGPIDIQVSVQNEQTSVSFVAQNAVVKEALEAAIPRLREMFSDSNLQLVNVDVGQREAGQSSSSADRFNPGSGGGTGSGHANGLEQSGDEEGVSQSPGIVTGIGLVDDYA
jgi:flagellar hook-length control protein FliK